MVVVLEVAAVVLTLIQAVAVDAYFRVQEVYLVLHIIGVLVDQQVT